MSRIAKEIAKTLLIVELAYVLLSFFFLNSGLLPHWINGKDADDLQIHYDFAYSLYPGSVHADGVTVRVSDPNVQLYFRLNGIKASFDLPALTRHEASINRVSIDGLQFWLRLRRWPKQLNPKLAAYLAPIPGLLPFKAPEKPTVSTSPPWHVRLREVQVNDVQELWIEEYRFQGHGTVTGDFYLEPGRTAQISKAVLAIHSGEVKLGESQVASLVQARLDAWIRPFDNSKLKGNQFFRYLSGDVQGTAHIVGVDFLNHYLRGVEPIRLSGGHGPLTANLQLRSGRLVRPSFLKVDAEDLLATLWDQRARGNGIIDWHIQYLGKRAPHPEQGRLTVTLPRFEVHHVGNQSVGVVGKGLKVLALSPDLSLEDPFRRLRVEIRSAEARITDLSYFQSYLPRATQVRIHGGQGTVSATVFSSSQHPGSDTGVLHLRTEGAQLDIRGAKLTGSVAMDAVLQEGDLRAGRFNISGTQIFLRKVMAATHFADRTSSYRDWWGNIDLRSGVLNLKKNKSFQGNIRFSSRDARPLLAIFTRDQLPGVLTGILSCDNLKASLGILVNDERLALSRLSVRGGSTAVYGWLSETHRRRLGRLLVWYGPLAAGLRIGTSGVSVILNDASRWFRQGVPAE